ncbi:MAG: hypothetical protein ACXVCP_08585 [Bdellovibrio sp.]
MQKRFSSFVILSGFLLLSLNSVAAPKLKDGGMSGGGGGTIITDPVGNEAIEQILTSSRRDLYLYFNKLSMYPYPTDNRIDNIKNRIQQIIADITIYPSYEGCNDKAGNDVDGSIYSPVQASICISIKNLGKKLTRDNAQAQTIALVGHEYAHLLGYSEEDAVFIQNWILSAFSNFSTAQSYEVLENVERIFQNINLNIDEAIQQNKKLDFNRFCFVTENIDSEIRKLGEQAENGAVSFFRQETFTARNSYVLKIIALKEAVCGFSSYHPQRDTYKKNYAEYFRNKKQITDLELERLIFMSQTPDVLGNVIIHKVDSIEEALFELLDIKNKWSAKALDEETKIKQLSKLPQKKD